MENNLNEEDLRNTTIKNQIDGRRFMLLEN